MNSVCSSPGSAEIGRPMRAPVGHEADLEQGMVFPGGPDEIAVRIIHLHWLLSHSRQILKMDIGSMPHETFLKSIGLLGTEVLPPRPQGARRMMTAIRRCMVQPQQLAVSKSCLLRYWKGFLSAKSSGESLVVLAGDTCRHNF